jgi:hypothetical protein
MQNLIFLISIGILRPCVTTKPNSDSFIQKYNFEQYFNLENNLNVTGYESSNYNNKNVNTNHFGLQIEKHYNNMQIYIKLFNAVYIKSNFFDSFEDSQTQDFLNEKLQLELIPLGSRVLLSNTEKVFQHWCCVVIPSLPFSLSDVQDFSVLTYNQNKNSNDIDINGNIYNIDNNNNNNNVNTNNDIFSNNNNEFDEINKSEKNENIEITDKKLKLESSFIFSVEYMEFLKINSIEETKKKLILKFSSSNNSCNAILKRKTVEICEVLELFWKNFDFVLPANFLKSGSLKKHNDFFVDESCLSGFGKFYNQAVEYKVNEDILLNRKLSEKKNINNKIKSKIRKKEVILNDDVGVISEDHENDSKENENIKKTKRTGDEEQEIEKKRRKLYFESCNAVDKKNYNFDFYRDEWTSLHVFLLYLFNLKKKKKKLKFFIFI